MRAHSTPEDPPDDPPDDPAGDPAADIHPPVLPHEGRSFTSSIETIFKILPGFFQDSSRILIQCLINEQIQVRPILVNNVARLMKM